MHSYHRQLLFATVFCTGAAVLIFEVAAVRALSPYFGSSLYVVSSVLSVILAALSLGYYFGGRIVDRWPRAELLYVLIAAAGLLMNALYALSLVVFPWAGATLSIAYGPLILSLCFFLVPAFLLGIDSPFVIKLLTTDDHEHNGKMVGTTFFWSTIGSIVGSLVTGFVLIPYLGIQLTFLGTATVLSLGAAVAGTVMYKGVAVTKDRRVLTLLWSVAGVAALVAMITLWQARVTDVSSGLVYQTDGYYSELMVIDRTYGPNAILRGLLRETNFSSGIILGTTTFAFQYAEYARAYQAWQTDTDTFLLIGGGAFTIPRTLLAEDPELHVEVVELEPKLYAIARDYFDLPASDRLVHHVTDARPFLQKTDQRYDVIFGDAYSSGLYVPPHLVTQEFFREIKNHLTPQGVFIMNAIGRIGQDELSFTGSLIKTMRSVFPALEVYAASNDLADNNNLIIIARANDESAVLPKDFLIDNKLGQRVPAAQRLIAQKNFHFDKQEVYTDNRSQAERLIVAEQLRFGF